MEESSAPPADGAEETEPVPAIRYTGTADARQITLNALRGDKEHPDDYLSWDRGNHYRIPWGMFVDSCGSEERAREIYSQHRHEFVVDGVEFPEEEEFSIGGTVA